VFECSGVRAFEAIRENPCKSVVKNKQLWRVVFNAEPQRRRENRGSPLFDRNHNSTKRCVVLRLRRPHRGRPTSASQHDRPPKQ